MPSFATAHTVCSARLEILGFPRVLPTNTGIFLGGLKLGEESRPWQVLLVSKKKIEGNHAFLDNKASIWKKKNCHTLLCILQLFRIIVA